MAGLRATLQNAGVRDVLLVWLAAALGSWAFTILLSLYAYDEGGAGAVGLAAVVRLLPAAFVAPSIALLTDRRPRRTVLGASLIFRGAGLAAISAVVAADGPLAGVLLFAALFTVAGTAHKPAQAGLLTQLARTPAQLAAANALWSGTDYVAFLGGSLLAGILAATLGLQAAFAVCAALFAAGALVLLRVPRDSRPALLVPAARRDVLDGLRMVLGDERMRMLTGIFGMTMLVQGMTDVLIVVAALELLDLGSGGPGWLSAAWAVGGLLGGAVAVTLIGRRRLGTGLIAGLLLAGLPLVAIGAWPGTANAVAGLVALGVGFGLMEVATLTLVQRLAADDVLGRIFGVHETLQVAAAAIGSVVASALVATVGTEMALVMAGLVLPAVALPTRRRRAALDAGAEVPETSFVLLRRVPLLQHLPISAVETLAVRAGWEEHPAGTDVVVQGESGDRFFVIAAGSVQVIAGDRRVAEQGPGGFFGEIALLRDAPRTATVRADAPLRLLTLDRVDFLAAIGSHLYTNIAADGIVAKRLEEIDGERRAGGHPLAGTTGT
jgi:MFS family permease